MVIWSEPAKSDLRSIHDFIAPRPAALCQEGHSGYLRDNRWLDGLPKMGKKVSELNDDNVRELSLYSYRIIYEIKNQHIFVLAVVRKRRDLKARDIER